MTVTRSTRVPGRSLGIGESGGGGGGRRDPASAMDEATAAAGGVAQVPLFGNEAWVPLHGAPPAVEVESDVARAQLVEPYSFVATDARGRWTVTVRAEERTHRGKTERNVVARCTCNWSVAVSRYGSTGFESVFDHLRDHVLSDSPVTIRVEETREDWSLVRLAGGRVHCASPACAVFTKTLPPGHVLACPEHGGSLHSRVYHWESVDPTVGTYSHEPGLLRAPDGQFWHFWCAPLEGRRLFGFVRADEQTAAD